MYFYELIQILFPEIELKEKMSDIIVMHLSIEMPIIPELYVDWSKT